MSSKASRVTLRCDRLKDVTNRATALLDSCLPTAFFMMTLARRASSVALARRIDPVILSDAGKAAIVRCQNWGRAGRGHGTPHFRKSASSGRYGSARVRKADSAAERAARRARPRDGQDRPDGQAEANGLTDTSAQGELGTSRTRRETSRQRE
jgi:hypothetical protein